MFSGSWNFLTTLVCMVESKTENWQWKLKKQNKPPSHFLLLTLSSRGKSSQRFYSLLVRRHHASRHTAKKAAWNAPKWKKKVWFTKPWSLTFAICWMIMLNSLTARFGVKADALGPGEVRGVPAVTDLSANTNSPLLVKSKSTERSGGM